jgi:hypothetical protein
MQTAPCFGADTRTADAIVLPALLASAGDSGVVAVVSFAEPSQSGVVVRLVEQIHPGCGGLFYLLGRRPLPGVPQILEHAGARCRRVAPCATGSVRAVLSRGRRRVTGVPPPSRSRPRSRHRNGTRGDSGHCHRLRARAPSHRSGATHPILDAGIAIRKTRITWLTSFSQPVTGLVCRTDCPIGCQTAAHRTTPNANAVSAP